MTKFPSEKELKEAREALRSGPAALPLPKTASPVDRTKHSLCEEIVKYMNKKRLTQRALAKEMGIDEALVSKLTHYQIDEFTVDRLIKYVHQLYPKVEVRVFGT